MNHKLVRIEWEDSRQPSSEWCWLSDYKPSGAVQCASVGWLIHEDTQLKALAQNLGDLKSESSQVSGIIQIPVSCIIKITELAETTSV